MHSKAASRTVSRSKSTKSSTPCHQRRTKHACTLPGVKPLSQYGECRVLRYNGDVYFGRMECGMADGYGATVTQTGGTAVLCSRLWFVQLATACMFGPHVTVAKKGLLVLEAHDCV